MKLGVSFGSCPFRASWYKGMPLIFLAEKIGGCFDTVRATQKNVIQTNPFAKNNILNIPQ